MNWFSIDARRLYLGLSCPVVFFHTHESHIGNCFGITVSSHASKRFSYPCSLGRYSSLSFLIWRKFTFAAVLRINGIYLSFKARLSMERMDSSEALSSLRILHLFEKICNESSFPDALYIFRTFTPDESVTISYWLHLGFIDILLFKTGIPQLYKREHNLGKQAGSALLQTLATKIIRVRKSGVDLPESHI